MRSAIDTLQPLGRALMLPIAVLPVAGLLLRLGQPDLLDIAFVSAAGDAIFAHLGLLFAIGVAVGFARDGNGAAALAGVVCFLIATRASVGFIPVPAEALAGANEAAAATLTTAFRTAAIARLEVPIGILSGLVGGLFYNRFATIKLPEYLAFFGGRRFVPIVAGLAGLGIALIVGLGYEAITTAIDTASRAILDAGGIGLFLYGVVNRLLLVTGLHHIVNNVAWFVIGDYQGTTGDLRRFFAGDPTAGAFMTGFFPVMMFGLPAACLAMYHEARQERRAVVGGMLFSLALTSFLTGVTEPIEFSFMFLAPALFAIHAVLTGLSMALMDALGVKLGFGFSAGLFDYLLNFGQATSPLLLLPIGLGYFALYYGLFRVMIRRFDLSTPGRGPDEVAAAPTGAAGDRGPRFVAALGGAANLRSVDACTTRLRLSVVDQAGIDEAALRGLGAKGVIRPSANALQVVLGPVADAVAMEIRDALRIPPDAPPAASVATPNATPVALSAAFTTALGGAPNVKRAREGHGRLIVDLDDPTLADGAALTALGARGFARVGAHGVHVLMPPSMP